MELVVDFADDDQKRELWKHLKACKPLPYRVMFKLERDNVSKQQRGYYWRVVIPTLADYCGYTHEEMHDVLKSEHNSTRKYIELTGKTIKVVHSTESLDVYEYGKYLDRVIIWANSVLGCRIPEPTKNIIQAV
jgi:hypothetical protein